MTWTKNTVIDKGLHKTAKTSLLRHDLRVYLSSPLASA